MHFDMLKAKINLTAKSLGIRPDDMTIEELLDRAIYCEATAKIAARGTDPLFVKPEHWFQLSILFFNLAAYIEEYNKHKEK